MLRLDYWGSPAKWQVFLFPGSQAGRRRESFFEIQVIWYSL